MWSYLLEVTEDILLMNIRNKYVRCYIFYRGFAAFVSYYVNHPLYTPPGMYDAVFWGAILRGAKLDKIC